MFQNQTLKIQLSDVSTHPSVFSRHLVAVHPCENFHLFKEDETMITRSEESLGASAAELEHDRLP